jgi:hypothetical protein
MLSRDVLAGDPVALDDPLFLVAAEVAVIEEALVASIDPPRQAFDRSHVEALRVAGASRDGVREYVGTLFNPRQVERLMDDLDSYGAWSGDAA